MTIISLKRKSTCHPTWLA